MKLQTAMRRAWYCPASEDTVHWFDVHFPASSFNGRIQIGYRTDAGIQRLIIGDRSTVREFLMSMHVSTHTDYYITANEVSGVERKKEQLFSLHNIVIDIDAHTDSMTEIELKEKLSGLLWRMDRDLKDVVSPTAAVFTGRGLQLWWNIDPVYKACLPYYEETRDFWIARIGALLEEYSVEFSGLSIDAQASKNVVGYFRLPGTYNVKAGSWGAVEIASNAQTYSLHELIPEIKVAKQKYVDEELSVKDKYHTDNSIGFLPHAVPESDYFTGEYTNEEIVLLRGITAPFFRVKQMVNLRMLRGAEIGNETRNNLCLIVYNSLLPAIGHEAAWKRLKVFNEGFLEPMSDKELEASICTSKKKNGYRYKNKTLIDFLDITPEEQDKIGLYEFTGQYDPFTRVSSNPSRRASARLAKDNRNARIIDLASSGLSNKAIAEQLEITPQTVAAVLKAQNFSPGANRSSRIQSMLQEGKNIAQIASELGCSERTVLRARKSPVTA